MEEDSASKACSFEQIRNVELKEIQRRRKHVVDSPGEADAAQVSQEARPDNLVGLAFSGGGIRSATFNLGVLQGLAELRLLPMIDYLSTVSGGGYIGSWLVAWIKRCGLKDVIEGLSCGRGTKCDTTPGEPPEPNPIHWLRRYSNYLTPQLGLFSADTWAMVASYLRNLLLNQAILIAALAALLLLPRLVAQAAQMFVGPWMVAYPLAALIPIGILLFFATLWIGCNMEAIRAPRGKAFEWWSKHWAVLCLIGGPLVVAACLMTCWIWFVAVPKGRPSWIAALIGDWQVPWKQILWLASAYSVPWLIMVLWRLLSSKSRSDSPESKRRSHIAESIISWLAAFAAGAFGGVLVWLVAKLFTAWSGSDGGLEHAMSWGTPLMILLFTMVAVLQIGLMGREFGDEKREWWARLGGLLLTLSLGWAGLFGMALYSPLALMALGVWVGGKVVGGILGGGWILSTLGGVLGGKSAKSGTKQSNSWLEFGVQAAPYVFVLGLLVLIAVGSHFALAGFSGLRDEAGQAWGLMAHGKIPNSPTTQTEWRSVYSDAALRLAYAQPAAAAPNLGQLHWTLIRSVGEHGYLLVVSWLALAFGALILSSRVDLNEFSMHLFYRNRLTRCYLGASNKKREHQAQPYTGFDANDDELLRDLSSGVNQDSSTTPKHGKHPPYAGPYLLINATLNLVKTKNLAWQQRKAESFIFSPRFCGFLAPEEPYAYRPTRAYDYKGTGGPQLGMAMAISGAAASPNMGYHSSPALAFLMTMFNVRLGWWLGNPQRKRWNSPGPGFGLYYLLMELMGSTNDKRWYVYLSDGGHFENLGIYELVRRRCKYIVACDAGADPQYQFEDLGNAIEKCRTDLGVDIQIDTDSVRPKPASRNSASHCTVGRIRYDLASLDESESEGTLVYLKATMTGNEPADVRHYADTNPTFPHQTTNDQWFDESQFESYRALGCHAVRSAFDFLEESETLQQLAPEGIFDSMRKQWYPPSKAPAEAFTKHTATLHRICETLRTTKELDFLNQQIYPEWSTLVEGTRKDPDNWLPTGWGNEVKIRSGFYVCNQLIQLMENVYTDLRLEIEYDHPDNRGWMNLFKHWSWSGMFRLTWAISACTYGARFQTFCKRRLDMRLGKVQLGEVIRLETVIQGGAERKFNSHEVELLKRFHVKYPNDSHLVVHPLEMVVSDPLDKGSQRTFVFGFCVVDHPSKHEGVIRYYRVQDHLREMGLARKGLEKFFDQYPHGDVRPEELKPLISPELDVDARSLRRFKNLTQSVRGEVR